jgi:hypothetical protein
MEGIKIIGTLVKQITGNFGKLPVTVKPITLQSVVQTSLVAEVYYAVYFSA